MKKPIVRVLTGCTAVGKTEWALQWAEARGAEIVSCDSLLFYRGMDIGTAKPTREERARVRHHLIDVCEVTERMDVVEYVKRARAAVEEIAGRGCEVLVTGGSGFYLKAFFAPVADDVEVPAAIREEVAGMTREAAVARLRELNPQGLGTLDVDNPRRVARGLERCLSSGRTMAELAEEFGRRSSAFADWEVELVRIDREPGDLMRRIEARVATMLKEGLVEEVRGLLGRGLEANSSAARAIGYRETIDLLQGRLRPEGLAEEIAKNTRGLVKKQRTWFRTQLPAHRVVGAQELRSADELF